MLLVLPYCQSDLNQTVLWLDWARDIGGAGKHSVLLLAGATVTAQEKDVIIDKAGRVFGNVQSITAFYEADRPWPVNANLMFQRAYWHIATTRPEAKSFFWCEPDCVPLRDGWLDLWEAEYRHGKKPFMGCIVQDPLHLTGNAVYPSNLADYSSNMLLVETHPWDVVDTEKILPHVHHTDLYQHCWSHGAPPNTNGKYSKEATYFKSVDDLRIVRPEAVLFHRNKDGSLIRFLRQRRGIPISGAPELVQRPSPAQRFEGVSRVVTPAPSGAPSLPEPARRTRGDATYGLLIRTYAPDAPWLHWTLVSAAKFVTGFDRRVIVAPESDAHVIAPMAEKAGWEFVACDNHPNGYLHQQVTKLYADAYLDTDFITIVDSDCIWARPCKPRSFFRGTKPLIYFESYNNLKQQGVTMPWQKITAKAMGCHVGMEFMRRHPFTYPRWLFGAARQHLEGVHKKFPAAGEYVLAQPDRSFSEFNFLGAYAYYYQRMKFSWWRIDPGEKLDPPFVKQYWSVKGITPEIEAEIHTIVNKSKKELVAK